MRKRWIAASALAMFVLAGAAGARDLAGESLDLEHFKGKVVLLDFWASWCAPCKASFPWMQQLRKRYASDDLVVIAVNVDHERTPAERFLQEQGAEPRADFPIIFDPLGRIAERFAVRSMPASFYIDRTGRVRFTHAGFRSADKSESEQQIASLIAEH
jgi:thiol-disulfide isomerase/thioredoxin